MGGNALRERSVLVRPTLEETKMCRYFVDLLIPGISNGDKTVARALKRCGPSKTASKPEVYGSMAQEFRGVIAALQRETRDELWGLGRKPLPFGTFAFLCQSMLKCETVEKATEVGIRIFNLLSADIRVSVSHTRADNQSAIVFEDCDSSDRSPNASALQGVLIVSVISLLSWISGSEVVPSRISITTNATPESRRYFRLYTPTVMHSAKETSLLVDRALMAQKLNPTTCDTKRFAKSFVASMLGGYRNETMVRERVLTLLRSSGPNDADQTAIARELGMSTATLRRRLQDEGVTNLSTLKEAYRRKRAMSLLRRTDLPIERISEELGFSEISAFHRAFKRWTSEAPGRYRSTVSTPTNVGELLAPGL